MSLAFSLAAPALAGEGSVDPVGPVFLPPAVGPVFVPPSAGTFPPEEGTDPIPPKDRPDFIPPSTGTDIADTVVEGLESAKEFCEQLADKQYTVDCIAERLAEVARQMPNTGEYAEARAAIMKASKKLHALAVSNKSSTAPRGRASRAGPNPVRTTRPLTPVSLDRLEQVKVEATKILAEAETVLLRSAASSESRQINYTRIAEAVGSNKVLLRSS